MKLKKHQLAAFAVVTAILSDTASANVRGMSSDQLAQFANSSSSPTVQPVRSIYNLSQAEQAYILAQVAQLNNFQAEEPVRTGFTTVSLKPRTARNNPIENIEETIEPKVIKSDQKDSGEKKEQVTANNESTESDKPNWMVKVFTPNNSNKEAAQPQPIQTQPVQQKRQIAIGQFGSAQVQKPIHQQQNNYVFTGENVLRRTTSSAPVIGTSQFYARGPATIQCVIEAANKHNVPAHVLLGIASKEYGRNGQTVKNTNASYDMGHFQLNTIHFRSGEAFSHINMEDARWRGCYNAELAAWHLNRQLTRKGKEGVDFWTRAGGYHSWTPGPNRIYVYGTAKSKGMKQYAQEWLTWLNKNQQYQARN